MPIDLVLFDCDGTLLESEMLMNAMQARRFQALGLACSVTELCERYSGTSYAAMIADLTQRYRIPIGDEIEAALEAEFLAAIGADLIPTQGAPEMLAAMPVPFCLASNAPRSRLIRMLRATGLLHLFGPRIVSAHDVEAGKPDPAVFLLAAELMGAAPEACLVIEDSVPGVRAARAAGMRVAIYTGAAHHTARTIADVTGERPDIHLQRLGDLLDFLPPARRVLSES